MYLYLKTIKDDTIPIPKKVGKDSGAVNFEDYLYSLDSVPTIDEIKQIEKEKVEKPEIPKLELLKDVKYDDFNEDKILYVFSQKNEWSLDASELYKDLNPSK